MNKLIAGISTLALVVMTSGVVSASTYNVGGVVGNNASANATSGQNVQMAGNLTLGSSSSNQRHSSSSTTGTQVQGMETGDATANASQENVVNNGCGCSTTTSHSRRNNTTVNAGLVAGNNATANATSGQNMQGGLNVTVAGSSHHSMNGGSTHGTQVQLMGTGNATANANQWNYVN